MACVHAFAPSRGISRRSLFRGSIGLGLLAIGAAIAVIVSCEGGFSKDAIARDLFRGVRRTRPLESHMERHEDPVDRSRSGLVARILAVTNTSNVHAGNRGEFGLS